MQHVKMSRIKINENAPNIAKLLSNLICQLKIVLGRMELLPINQRCPGSRPARFGVCIDESYLISPSVLTCMYNVSD